VCALGAAKTIYNTMSQYNGYATVINTEDLTSPVDSGYFRPDGEGYGSVLGFDFIVDNQIFTLSTIEGPNDNIILTTKKESDIFKLKINNTVYSLKFFETSFENEYYWGAEILDKNNRNYGYFYVDWTWYTDENDNRFANSYFNIEPTSAKEIDNIHSIELYTENHELKKLDPKFLNPVDWNSNNVNTGEYIKNRPFGDFYD